MAYLKTSKKLKKFYPFNIFYSQYINNNHDH